MINSANIIGEKDFRVIFVGNLSHKKGYQTLLMAFDKIYRHDSRHTLHIFGRVDEMRASVFMDNYIMDAKLQGAVQYYGHVNNLEEFLPEFTYFLVTSPLEGCSLAILECMNVGVSPLIFAFVGARDLYPDYMIWKNFDELIEMIKKGPQNPEKIKQFVKDNYSLDRQLSSIDDIVSDLMLKPQKDKKRVRQSTTSAVMAVKNGEKTITRALNSLIKQTKPLKKIVVVDDGSTDKTVEIVNKFNVNSEIPIQLISIAPSRWVFEARNEGVKFVDSDYMFFLDSDDMVEPNYVEKLTEPLDINQKVDIVYPDMIYFNENGNERLFNVPDFDPQMLAQRNFVAYASMQRTAKFKELGGYSLYLNESRNHMTEWDLWLRYMKIGGGFLRFKEPLFHYFKSGNSIQMSGNYERSREDMHLQIALAITDNYNIMMNPSKERVLLVCQGKDYLDRSKVGFELMEWRKPLEINGKYEVYTFQYDVEGKHFGRDGMIERLKKFVQLVDPKYIFHPTYKDDIPVSVWEEISERWNTICLHSDEWRYNEFCKEYEKGFKFAVTTYPSVYEQMEHSGKILSQWAANQYYFKPNESRDIDVSFVGQKHTNRQELLAGSNVECWGKGWPNGFLDFSEMAKILGRSKINICLSMGVKGRQLKLRPFETTASGALCLCETMPGIEKYFVDDEEIVLFDTKEEMEELIKYYLEHEDEREEIAQAGYNRTISEHLWEHRLSEIFGKIGG